MKYRFWGWEHADAKAITAEYKGIETPVDLYDALSHVWCADTCAPRMRQNWIKENMTLGQCSITAFGDEVLDYEENPEQFREVHFAKEEKRMRYEKLKEELKKYCERNEEK